MDHVHAEDAIPESISVARCRELLGEEAAGWTDADVDRVRQHAHAMAVILVDMFLVDQGQMD